MSELHSIELLGKWLAIFRQMDENATTTEHQVAAHLDGLAHVITSMTIDFELAGLETFQLKTLSLKQAAYQQRILSKRFAVLDEIMFLSSRLIRAEMVETPATSTPTNEMVHVDLGDCIKTHKTMGVHAQDESKPWVTKQGHGNYLVARSKLHLYILPNCLSKYANR